MEIIKKDKVKLIRWLRSDNLILQHVQSENLITTDEYTKLKMISDPGTQITELLDLMLQKENKVCFKFLELLKDDDVNESSPALREWIKSVNTTLETQLHAPQDPQPPQGNRPSIAMNNNPRLTDNEMFLKRNRGKLIDKVKAVDRIVDDLNFTGEKAERVQAEQTDQAKMRKLLDYTTTKKAAQLLVNALYKHEADVMEELTMA
ncbi:uncharacterized protein LOC128524346 [Clarias gariepinus]|uniref:uncharacterized protein LOC128524346 n=1 Tax=Clarias gariepinus TaxID=13013 RepID=UPI00234DBB65|nr:uncharacterized protein LOC128524346 [Clarias gariepinus]